LCRYVASGFEDPEVMKAVDEIAKNPVGRLYKC
jgi:hypothetical protein